MRKPNSNIKGFTLIQLAVVVAIAVVLMAMAVPVANTVLTSSRLQAAVSTVTGAIQAARMEAISTNQPIRLTFSTSASTYQVAYCSSCSVLQTTGTYTNGHVPQKQGGAAMFPAAVAFTGAGSGVTMSAAYPILYMRPGGAVQTTEGTTNCATPVSLTLSYKTTTKTITVGCYGQITVQ